MKNDLKQTLAEQTLSIMAYTVMRFCSVLIFVLALLFLVIPMKETLAEWTSQNILMLDIPVLILTIGDLGRNYMHNRKNSFGVSYLLGGLSGLVLSIGLYMLSVSSLAQLGTWATASFILYYVICYCAISLVGSIVKAHNSHALPDASETHTE